MFTNSSCCFTFLVSLSPVFNSEETKIPIQSAVLSEDHRRRNIGVVGMPKKWLKKQVETSSLVIFDY